MSVLQCEAGDSEYPIPVLNRLCFIEVPSVLLVKPGRSDVPRPRRSVLFPLNGRNNQDDELIQHEGCRCYGYEVPFTGCLGGWVAPTSQDSVAKHGVQRRYSSCFEWGVRCGGTNHLYKCHKLVQGLAGSGSSVHIHM